jgi:hypothetical protein
MQGKSGSASSRGVAGEGEGMDEDEVPERLSRISTAWTLVAQACGGPGAAAPSAQEGPTGYRVLRG